MDNLKRILEETQDNMKQIYAHLNKEFTKIRAGKASPEILENIRIDYYGTLTPLNQVANINIPDARTIVVQPWDKSILGSAEKAILAANLGITPVNTGEIIRISIPQLTEERRKELVKKAKQESENSKVAVRNIRRNANEKIKNLEKSGVPEDEIKQLEKEVQNCTDKWIEEIDKLFKVKEEDILTIK